MKSIRMLLAAVLMSCIVGTASPAVADESSSPTPTATSNPEPGESTVETSVTAPEPQASTSATDQQSVPTQPEPDASPHDGDDSQDIPSPTTGAASALSPEVEYDGDSENPTSASAGGVEAAAVSTPTLTVRSSQTGAVFKASTGNYVFEGAAPPGRIQIQWANSSVQPLTWRYSVQTTAGNDGAFHVEAPIGPWEATFSWRAVSPDAPGSPSSPTFSTVVQRGVTLDVWSTTTGSRFYAGYGNYVFGGSAPQGGVTIWWRTPGTSTWKVSTTTQAWSTGTYRVEVPIGPWPGSVEWRTTSNLDNRLAPSVVRSTVIHPSITFDVWSTTTGSRFVAGYGNYVFGGSAPQGGVTIWWRTPGTSAWKVSTTTQAWSTGTYRVEVPIGPWPGSVEWRATSNLDARLSPSNARLTVIAPSTPAFTYSARRATAADLGITYRSGCPVGPSQLSVISMNHWGFDGVPHTGELVVRNQDVAKAAETFRAAFNAKFPIRKMVNPRHYSGANDVTMMEDDNTSAFNCRQVVGNPYRMSPHSYGYAFDINPRENPYYAAGVWYPQSGAAYINRGTRRPGMHFSNTVFPSQFVSRGGHWGASYSDYHHFETIPR